MPYYINTRTQGAVETVDQFNTYREAREMLREYHISSPGMGYYLSRRSTRDWRESEEQARKMTAIGYTPEAAAYELRTRN